MTTDRFELTLNGKPHAIVGQPANRPLLDYLRSIGMTGSKQGCAEGDCGACTVALVETDAHGARTYRAINSCITLVPMVAGREIVTVEGLAGEGGALHPVQAAMVARHGSQCGYCTPGFTVSMMEAYYRGDVACPEKIADQLQGNLCRCTGYRPIRDAMNDALAYRGACSVTVGGERPHPPARPADRLLQVVKKPAAETPALAYEAAGQTFLRPTSLDELLRLRAAHPEADRDRRGHQQEGQALPVPDLHRGGRRAAHRRDGRA
jgi:xanthine dehydrogenase iron-sulfur cluster and FAD-binding subunit A